MLTINWSYYSQC